ncbi:phosphatase PAP2 family protein [Puerhibacterium sp. TATVAM-FAB25]|uniref:phosphatase PAP2 family protein n=1 Tax=Puerhibacterium sp. TATVAM-FAB25 TaxID=3093699 RepID=UPI00397DE451
MADGPRRDPTGRVARGARPGRWSAVALAVAGACCLVALAVLYLGAVRTAVGQAADVALFARAQAANAVLERPASALRVGLPAVLLGAYLAVALGALRRGRRRALLASAVLVGAALPLARALRESWLDRPYLGEHGYLENTFPSGHVALAAALAAAVAVLWPWAGRGLVAAGGAVAVALAAGASVVGHAHRPSDVVGSVLLVAALACAAAAAARVLPPDRQGGRRRQDRYSSS